MKIHYLPLKPHLARCTMPFLGSGDKQHVCVGGGVPLFARWTEWWLKKIYSITICYRLNVFEIGLLFSPWLHSKNTSSYIFSSHYSSLQWWSHDPSNVHKSILICRFFWIMFFLKLWWFFQDSLMNRKSKMTAFTWHESLKCIYLLTRLIN